MKIRSLICTGLPMLMACFVTACSPSDERVGLPGYLETDLIEMASPEAGYLRALPVNRGQTIETGTLLFRLESAPVEKDLAAARERRLAAESRAKDATQGEREEVLTRLQANVASIQASFNLAKKEYTRVVSLARSKAVAQEKLDIAVADLAKATEQMRAAEADLALAGKGQRPLQIEALEAEASALQSVEDSASWREAQLQLRAPESSVVEDTLYEPGEWVPAGHPIVVLRRLTDLRARFFVSPADAATLTMGEAVQVRLPGDEGKVEARIVRVANQAEYTPPVIYSREQSERLVLMVEAELSKEDATRLHPGLPVTVEIP